MTAVLLELGELRVRTGVWEHTRFRDEPLARLRRTGHAAMMTTFAARSRAQALIAKVNRGHARIGGHTPDGTPYRADDVELLTWVQATASFGFLEAYRRCVRPLPASERDAWYAENQPGARLYGVVRPPVDEASLLQLFETMRPSLEPSPIVHEFLAIMGRMPLLPVIARPLQRLLVRAAVQCLPAWARVRLELDGGDWQVSAAQWRLLRLLGRAADHLDHPELPRSLAAARVNAARAASSSTTAS